MKKLMIFFLFVGVSHLASSQDLLFEPGNLIFADPFDDQIIEISFDLDAAVPGEFLNAEIVNAVQWDLAGFERRRPLGLDIDPNGNVWVGVTATGDTEAEFPLGLGQALRIERDGTQSTFNTDLIKITFLAATSANQVIVGSNVGDQNDVLGGPDQSFAQMVEITNDGAELTTFNKSSYGEALRLPDGTLLMGDNGLPGIHIYEETGGDSIGVFYDDGRNFQSLTYVEAIDSIVALSQDSTLVRISMDGEMEEEFDTSDDGFTGLWGIADIPGTNRIIVGSHNVGAVFNQLGIFLADDFAGEFPTVVDITSGFEEVGLPIDHVFRSFFNLALVPEEVQVPVSDWSIF